MQHLPGQVLPALHDARGAVASLARAAAAAGTAAAGGGGNPTRAGGVTAVAVTLPPLRHDVLYLLHRREGPGACRSPRHWM